MGSLSRAGWARIVFAAVVLTAGQYLLIVVIYATAALLVAGLLTATLTQIIRVTLADRRYTYPATAHAGCPCGTWPTR